jgi:hypothetical protein
VGYWNLPAAETATSAYFCLIALLIAAESCGITLESVSALSRRQTAALPIGGQAGLLILILN